MEIREVMALDIDDSAFVVMKEELNIALLEVAKRMLTKDGKDAAVTLKIGLEHKYQLDDVTGEKIEQIGVDYKITAQMTEKAMVDGTVQEFDLFGADIDSDGQLTFRKIPDRQHKVSEYL